MTGNKDLGEKLQSKLNCNRCKYQNQKIFRVNPFLPLILFSLFLLLSSTALAIPGSLTLQGKLTNLAGASQTGAFNFSFRIYDAYTGGNRLYESKINLTTDANGIYDVVLQNLSSLNFSDQYYLGIMVMGDNEMEPRINLTSSPYSFRANVSEALNRENRYEIAVLNVTGNLTLGQDFDDVLTVTTGRLNISDGNIISGGNLTLADRITFRFSQIIDNLVSGFLRISGNLNVTGNVSIAQDTLFVDNTSGRVGIGTALPSDTLTVIGSLATYGSLNATFINATRILIGSKPVQASEDFNLGNISNYSQFIQSKDFNLGNISNYSQYIRSTDFNLGNISNNTLLRGDNSSISLWNISGSDIFPRLIAGKVGIGTASPNEKLVVIGNVNISGTLNVSGKVSFPNLASCTEALETDSNGVIVCGTDAGGASDIRNSTAWNRSSTNVILANIGDNVGIGTTAPNDALEVIGNVRVSGSLNATGINATRILVGNEPVQLSKDFNLGNISNYSQYIRSTDFNLGNISNYTQYIRSTDFNLGNISNYSQFIQSKDFNLGNISNDTLKISQNVSIAFWNLSFPTDSITRVLIFPRDLNSSVLIGFGNVTQNVSDVLTIIGSVSTFGSFNATFINATRILVGNEPVQLSKDFNLGNISNYSQYIRSTDFNLGNISNYTQYIRSTDFNLGNISNYSQFIQSKDFNLGNISNYSQYIRSTDFNLGNITNDTIPRSGNASVALWNISEVYLFPREAAQLVRIGNPNTNLSNDTFAVMGSASVYGSFNATYINASRILIGSKPVQASADFNLGNISNYTQYIRSTDFNLGNISNYTQYIRSTDFNLGNISNYSQYTRSTDFNLGNISNYSQFIQSKDFNLGNISNDTLKISQNVSIAFWNLSFPTDSITRVLIFPRDLNSSILIGFGNVTQNVSDVLTIIGSVSTFGSFNATFINATRILIGSKPVQASADFNLGNISNYTQYIRSTDFNLGNISNYTQYIRSTDFNLGNISNYTQYIRSTDFNLGNISNYSQYTRSTDFNLGNISNNTLLRGDNSSISLWNISGSDIFPRNITNRVGIGTTGPSELLHVYGASGSYGGVKISGSAGTYNSILKSFFDGTNYGLQIQTGTGVPLITFNNLNSNVGIGTTSPTSLLHLNKTDNFNTSVTNVLTIDHTLNNPFNSTGGVGVSILFRATDNASQIYNIANISAILYNSSNGTQAGALTFSTSGADTGDGSFGHLTERMRINANGSVGIGTTNPAEKLVVIGNVNISGTLNVSGMVAFPNLASCDTINTDANGVLSCGTDAGGASDIRNSTAWNRSSTNVVLANIGDNVGIGTTSPASKLEVAGTFNATQGTTSFRVTSDNNIIFHLE